MRAEVRHQTSYLWRSKRSARFQVSEYLHVNTTSEDIDDIQSGVILVSLALPVDCANDKKSFEMFDGCRGEVLSWLSVITGSRNEDTAIFVLHVPHDHHHHDEVCVAEGVAQRHAPRHVDDASILRLRGDVVCNLYKGLQCSLGYGVQEDGNKHDFSFPRNASGSTSCYGRYHPSVVDIVRGISRSSWTI
jgi:hypothetical protein